MGKTSSTYKIATLFSGAGGLDSGFVKTGKFENQIANDILQPPAETYSKNHHAKILTVDEFNMSPTFPCYIVGDVSSVDFHSLKKIDCVIGGPPCQDFSVTRGSRESLGIHMTRGKLYSHFIRALTKTKPKVFVFENVPGLRSANNGLAYKTITSDFENLNVRESEIKNKIHNRQENPKNYFLIFNSVVDSANVGVPQKRRRLIIIGVRKDLIKWPAESEMIKKSQEVLLGEKSLLSKYPLTAMEVFEGKTVPEVADKYKKVMEEYKGIEKEVGTGESHKWKIKTWDKLTFDAVKDYISANRIKPNDDEEIESAFDEHKCILKDLGYYGKPLAERSFDDDSNKIPKEGQSVTERMGHIPPDMNYLFVEGTEWKVKGTMSNIYRRNHPLKPAYTVMAYGGGGTWSYHYERKRGMLTNRERARLQTFSDDYMFFGNRSEVRAQIGEAVPVMLGIKLAEVTQFVLEKVKS